MLSFKENFFFIRFAVLFFILVIFGYWGIDLNSEEVYIAFTFLFLVVASFVMVRRGILFFFVKAVNGKYARLVGDLLLIVGALSTQTRILNTLSLYLPTLSRQINLYTGYVVSFLRDDLFIFTTIYRAKVNYLLALSSSSFYVLAARLVRSKTSSAFFGKFFDINL